MSRASIFEIYNRLSEGSEEFEEYKCPGINLRLQELRDKFRKLMKLVWVTSDQIAHDEINLTKVCAKLTPKSLTQEQKEHFLGDHWTAYRKTIHEFSSMFCKVSKDALENPNISKNVKCANDKPKVKTMLIVIMTKWVLKGRNVNQKYYRGNEVRKRKTWFMK